MVTINDNILEKFINKIDSPFGICFIFLIAGIVLLIFGEKTIKNSNKFFAMFSQGFIFVLLTIGAGGLLALLLIGNSQHSEFNANLENIEKLQSENRKLNTEISELQYKVTSYSNLQKEFLALQDNYSELNEAKNDLERDVQQITLENTSLKSDNFELTKKLNAVTVSFDNLQIENNALKLDNETLKNNIFAFMKDSKVFNGHHYKVFNITTLWPEAKRKCEEMGGHLCTTNSLAEFNFIKTLLDPKNEYWLGASDADREGDWKWITDEQLSMTKWYSSRPYNNNNRNFLVLSHINDSTWYWYDGRNKGTAFFICEWDF